MRVYPSLRRLAAALLLALLPLGLPQGGVHAQSGAPASQRTVTNIAEATWEVSGSRQRTASNPVRFEVNLGPVAAPAIRVYRRTSAESGSELVYRAPQCGPATGPVQLLQAGATASISPGSSSTSSINTAIVQETDTLRGGEPLFFEISAPSANRDPAAIAAMFG